MAVGLSIEQNTPIVPSNNPREIVGRVVDIQTDGKTANVYVGDPDNDDDNSGPHRSIVRRISDVDTTDEARIATGLEPFDKVLGGGLVIGSVVLLGGEPGSGKSTALMQAAAGFARNGHRVLYATGEESESQVALRAKRLDAIDDSICLVRESDAESILAHALEHEPDVLIIDSISTLTTENANGAAGSVSQVRICAQMLSDFARESGCSVLLIGHVTRDGTIAGPRTLDHVVDVVLHIGEADHSKAMRIVSAHKNRYGDVTERGCFEMTATGLVPVWYDVENADGANSDPLVPVLTEIVRRFRELGGVIDEGLRDRLAGRIELD